MELLIGKKLGMTQIFHESGKLTPVSVIQAGPCPIVQVKTPETDGYSAVQIGFGDVREKNMTLPLKGHYGKAGVAPQRVLKEFRVDDTSAYKVGESLDASVFDGISKVDVTGRSKGRGFAGTIKRHNFSLGPKTHGSHDHRKPGSVGLAATPARVFKGKRMPGRMGGNKETVRNLEVVQIDTENNLIYVKGAIPGSTNGIVFIHKS